jgi:hypothetical protein
MLRFEDQEDFIELDMAMQETEDLPSRGDACLTVRVSAAGLTGHNDLWVLAPAFRAFCQAVVRLERDRRGAAVLESISPEELHFVIRSVDSCGHMAVEGSTGYEVQRGHYRHWHSVTFRFQFDPSQLVKAVSVDWVRRNAETDAAPNSRPPSQLSSSPEAQSSDSLRTSSASGCGRVDRRQLDHL